MRSAPLHFLNSGHEDLLLLRRGEGHERLWVAINRGDSPQPLSRSTPAGPPLWTSGPMADGDTTSLAGRSALILADPTT